jgi:D-mannonate dehydratase
LYDADVRRHARALLQAATALPAAERPAETEQLRRALVEAGEVDLAQTTAAG